MKTIIFVLCFIFTGANADDINTITVENIYASAVDYNPRIAKEKAFLSALNKAKNILLLNHNTKINIPAWRLRSKVVSYSVKQEQIEQHKYMALYDIVFNKEVLNTKNNSDRTSELGNKSRALYQINHEDKFSFLLIKGLAQMMGVSFLSYDLETKVFSEDFLISVEISDQNNFIITINHNNSIINISAKDLRNSFASVMNIIANELYDNKNKSVNIIIMESVSNISSDKDKLKKHLARYLDISKIEIIGYNAGNVPIYAIKITEKDDLFLTYVYNSNDYILSDLRIFNQILDIKDEH